jgi:hypothetical protein
MNKDRNDMIEVAPAVPWQNRIVGHGEVAPDTLIGNPLNFRTHSAEQEATLSGVISRLGVVAGVTVNRTTGHLMDGHLRVQMAMRQGQAIFPVTYIEVSADEEKLLLAAFDQITAMAGRDTALLDTLLTDIRASDIGKDLGVGLEALLASLQAETIPFPPQWKVRTMRRYCRWRRSACPATSGSWNGTGCWWAIPPQPTP